MAEQRVLKGIYKEGPAVASAIISPENKARILVKGVEPHMPRDPAFAEGIRRVIATCKEHLAGVEETELCAVLTQAPAMVEHVTFNPDELAAMGLVRILGMDGDCGLVVRMSDTDPAPTTLSYSSLRTGQGIPEQPGLIDVASNFLRKTYKSLTTPQQQLYGLIVQLGGRGLLKLVCVDDEGIKAAVSLKDLPPARARSLVIPFGALAAELAAGATLEAIAKKLDRARAG